MVFIHFLFIDHPINWIIIVALVKRKRKYFLTPAPSVHQWHTGCSGQFPVWMCAPVQMCVTASTPLHTVIHVKYQPFTEPRGFCSCSTRTVVHVAQVQWRAARYLCILCGMQSSRSQYQISCYLLLRGWKLWETYCSCVIHMSFPLATVEYSNSATHSYTHS